MWCLFFKIHFIEANNIRCLNRIKRLALGQQFCSPFIRLRLSVFSIVTSNNCAAGEHIMKNLFDSEDGVSDRVGPSAKLNKVNIDTISIIVDCSTLHFRLLLSRRYPSSAICIQSTNYRSAIKFLTQQQLHIHAWTTPWMHMFHNSNEWKQQPIRCRHSNYVIIMCVRVPFYGLDASFQKWFYVCASKYCYS